MVNWRLGTIGFGYKQWVGAFYPAGMNSRNFLAHYSQLFDTVEIDSSFYGPPTVVSVQRWADVTPDGFVFCPKTPSTITHELRLVDAVEPMLDFLKTLRLLGPKLGPVLIQFPPDFTHDYFSLLFGFLRELPNDLRYAVEFRHRSWETPGTTTLLERYNICWTVADYIYMPKMIRRTTDFLYLRFIGPHGQYVTKDQELADRTADLQQWYQHALPLLDQVNEVYAFFNNDYSGYSPATCNRFKKIVGLEQNEIRPYRQGRLF